MATQNRVPPSRTDITVLSETILPMSQGELRGAGKSRRPRARRVLGCSNLCNYRVMSMHQPSSGRRASEKDVALQRGPGSPTLP